MSVIIIDNFDSFTFNLVHIIEQLCSKFKIIRNNKVNFDEISLYDKIIISPGPGLPSDIKIIDKIIQKFAKNKSILGVCLGHQAIIESFGGKIFNMERVHHGLQKKTIVTDKNEPIYKNIPKSFLSGRYHSWAADNNSIPDSLKITAVDNSGLIMSVSHKLYDIRGVQYHPESLMTPYGKQIFKNWIKM